MPKLKEPDPNPGVVVAVLAAIGEQAQVSGVEMKKWMDDLLPIILDMLQDSSSLLRREVGDEDYRISVNFKLLSLGYRNCFKCDMANFSWVNVSNCFPIGLHLEHLYKAS